MLTEQVSPGIPAFEHVSAAASRTGGHSRSLLVAGVIGLSSLPVVLELVLDLFSR